MPPTIALVDSPDGLRAALDPVDAPVVGVDVERADSHRYYRTPALIQVGVNGHCVLIDTVAVTDCRELDRFLAERDVVLHALENDLVPLEVVGVRPHRLHDTAVAAAVLGLPTGLSPLLAQVLEIELTADKERFQRADWEARPLTEDMAAYAAGDVVHLPALWTRLTAELEAAGRTSWYEQELAVTIAMATEDNRRWERTRGAGRLSPRGRAVLAALWAEREALAKQDDVAPQRIVHDETLISLAHDPPATAQQVVTRTDGRRRRHIRPYAERLAAAAIRGQEDPPQERDPDRPRWEDRDRDAFDAMRRVRSRIAKDIGLDAGVLCPSRQLKEAVSARPTDASTLCAEAGLRPWQVDLLAEPLWEAYSGAYSGEAGSDGPDG